MSEQFLHIECGNCGARLKTRVGKTRFKCPKCLQSLEIPATDLPAAPTAPPAAPSAPAFANLNVPPPPAPAPAPLPNAGPTPAGLLPVAAPPTVEPPAVRRYAGLAAITGSGLLLGALFALVLSASKKDIHFQGLVVALAWGGGVLVGLIVLRGLVSLLEAFASGRSALAVDRLRRWSGAAVLLGAGSFVVCALLVGAEAIHPEDSGFVNRILDRQKAESDAAKDKEIADARKIWTSADFFLVNPSHRALAIKNESSDRRAPRFKVVAKAAEAEAQKPLELAWDHSIAVLGTNPALARRLFDRYNADQPIDAGDTSTLHQLTIFRRIMPKPQTRLVEVVDSTTRQRRFGHLLPDLGQGQLFCDLVPKANTALGHITETTRDEELFLTERVAGTDAKEVPRWQLEQSADYLQYGVYFTLSELQNSIMNSDDWLRPRVFVDEVVIEHDQQNSLIESINRKISKLREGKRTAQVQILMPQRPEVEMRSATGLAAILSVLGEQVREYREEMSKKKLAEDVVRDIEKELQELENDRTSLVRLAEISRQVDRDLLSLLVRTGVAVVDRPQRARGLYCDSTGDKWERPTADVAVHDNLVQASHLLIASIDKPEKGGSYHISLRLRELRSGEIRAFTHGDRHVLGYRPFDAPMPTVSAIPPVAAAPKPLLLEGQWRCKSSNVSVRVSESNKRIHVSLVTPHDRLEEFELFASRDDKRVDVSNCYLVFKAASGSQIPRNAEMKILDDNHIEIAYQAVDIVKRKLVYADNMVRLVFEKQ